MENFKSWAVCVVASSAVAAVVEFIAPEGAGEKSVKFITSVFVLLAFVSPLSDLKPLPYEYTQGIDGFVEEYELEKQIELQAKQSLESQITSELCTYIESIGCVCESVTADVVIDFDKNIYIDSIAVCISEGNEEIKRKIADYSRETFGVNPQIKVRE